MTKATVTVFHYVLLTKLYYTGVSGITFEWTDYFIANRCMQNKVSRCLSQGVVVSSGARQGLVHEQFFFLIYVYFLIIVFSCKIKVFAHDTKTSFLF